ncbi:hypothetical protein GRI75_06025 [Altererythrobacter soli]|uniref:Peptidase S9 prolyl oligopeptidase catalytic domain-containing protein n=1 Tax=Croceibacterium soli TaxID=1739690 RepID=A0A6I4UQZ4_9SPHN|nr:hypothetical protein [Croceibacterium soli]MXP41201.1 hypothetical protein [Croceibacterium soli]
MRYPAHELEYAPFGRPPSSQELPNFNALRSWRLASVAQFEDRWVLAQSDTPPVRLRSFATFPTWERAASPSGRYVVGYSDLEGVRSFSLLNTASAAVRELAPLSAPDGEPAWSPDEQHVVLIGGLAKGSSEVDPKAGFKRYRESRIILVSLNDNKSVDLGPTYSFLADRIIGTTEAEWLSKTHLMLSRIDFRSKQKQSMLYRLVGGTWRQEGIRPAAAKFSSSGQQRKLPDLSVTLEQGANQPPVVVAKLGVRYQELTKADLKLSIVRWSQSTEINWQDPDGKQYSAGLWLPRGYIPRTPIPIVIQNYFYNRDFFLPDGPFRGTGDSAQALAARGIGVVQLGSISRANTGRLEEVTEFYRELESLVHHLVQSGLADQDRIGYTGFSRSGFLGFYAVTHPGKYPLAAAVLVDAYTGSFSDHLRFKSLVYGKPFYEDKKTWIEHETTFNADRIRTPTLRTTHMGEEPNKGDYIGIDHETLGAYAANDKPIEWLFFPEGGHHLQRPREHLYLNEATVDWMAFWLKGEVPANVHRARRWLMLRTMQEAVLAKLAAKGEKVAPLPPLVAAPEWAKPEPLPPLPTTTNEKSLPIHQKASVSTRQLREVSAN